MSSNQWIAVFVALLVAPFSSSGADNTVSVRSQYYVDAEGANSEGQVLASTFNQWSELAAGASIDVGFNQNATVWLRYDLLNTSHETHSVVINLADPNLDSVEVLYPFGRELMGDWVVGSWLPALVPHGSVALRHNESVTVFLRVKKVTSYLRVAPQLTTAEDFLRQESIHLGVSVFISAILVVLLFFNVATALHTRKAVYAWYVLLALVNLGYIGASTGLLKAMVMPGFIYVSHVRLYAAFFSPLMFCVFLYHFVPPTTASWVSRALRLQGMLLLAIVVVSTVFYVPLMRFQLIQHLVDMGYTVVLLLMLTTVLHLFNELRFQRKRTLLVLSAFSLILLAIIVLVLKEVQLIDIAFPRETLELIISYETIVFGMALAQIYINAFAHNNRLLKELALAKGESLRNLANGELNERSRLSALLHDYFGGRLVTLGLMARKIKDRELITEVDQLGSDLRNLSHQIMPTALRDGRLTDAFKQHLENLNRVLGHEQFQLYCFEFPAQISEPWTHDVFLVLVELCTNSIKHSKADHAVFEFYNYGDHYLFHYSDDGVGFEPGTINSGNGLTDIRSRVQIHKGSFEIDSRTGTGTEIFITIPIE